MPHEGFRLSPQQRRLWSLLQLDGGAPYQVRGMIAIDGDLDAGRLSAALRQVVERHEILRTRIQRLPGTDAPVQIIESGGAPALAEHDLRGQAPEQQVGALAALLDQLGAAGFDTEHGPALRAALVSLAPRQHTLLLALPSLLADGPTLAILARDLARAYAAGSAVAWPDEPPQYADLAEFLNELLESGETEAGRLHWRQQDLAALGALRLPFEQARASVSSTESTKVTKVEEGDQKTIFVPFVPFVDQKTRASVSSTESTKSTKVTKVEEGDQKAIFVPFVDQKNRARFTPRVCRGTLPAALAARVAALARATSTAAWLLTAWQTLLWRLSEALDVSVGVLYDGRSYAELGVALGPLARYAPVRCRLDERTPFDALARQSHAAIAEAARWQEYFSWEQLAAVQTEALPFIPFCFDFVAAPPPVEARDVSFALRQSDACIDRFKARLVCIADAGGLDLELHYDTALFADAAAERMLGMLLALVEDTAARPQSLIGELEILGAAERRRLLDLAVAAVADPPCDACIHRLFEQQAARTPDAVALVGERRTTDDRRPTTGVAPSSIVYRLSSQAQHLTYRELNRRANRLAHYLRRMGVGPETLVAICMERSLEMVVALLGVLKAGGAYVPLDPAYPSERIAFMLTDAEATVLLTQKSIYDLRFMIYDLGYPDGAIVNRKSKIVNLDADWPQIARQSVEPLDSEVSADNLAYVIYTSGSTGVPKGVLARHRSVVHFWTGLRERVYADHAGAQLRATLNAPLVFDASVKQLVLLLDGHALWIVPEELRRDGQALLAALRRARVDVLDCTPSLLRALIAAGLLDRAERAPPLILLGGEPIDDALWQQLRSLPDIAFYNHYGPTECTVNATICQVGPELVEPTLGRPIANTRLYLLDQRMRPVPIGVPGEVYIGGAGLARGYLNRPDLTAERFIPNPFVTPEDERRKTKDEGIDSSFVLRPSSGTQLYKTGDVARYYEDGSVEFLGRSDRQIKLRGYRIELGEVEATLCQHPTVRAAVVLAREDAPGDRRLVAYVVPVEGSGVRGQESGTTNDHRPPTNDEDRGLKIEDSDAQAHTSLSSILYPLSSELRSFLAERLPDYMLPSAFVALDALPLTAGGKIDRRALPVPRLDPAGSEDLAAQPRTPAERLLARIWAEVLRVEQVGRDDNFFALGGDSLLCIQVVVRAGQAGLRLRPQQVFEQQTLAALAAVAEVAPALQPSERMAAGPLPLTPIQRWFFEQELPDPHDWTQTTLLELRQPAQLARLARAVHALLARHDVLRLRFVRDGEGWRQLLADPPAAAPVRYVDLSALPRERQTSALEGAVAGLRAALRLEQGPLLQVALIDLGSDQPMRLLLVTHALAADGFSYRLLAEDLQAIYRQLGQGYQVRLPPATSFARWTERLAEYARSDALRQEAAFWLAEPAPPIIAPPLDFPGLTTGVACAINVALEVEETRALLRDLPSASRTRIDAALLAALARTFAGQVGAGSLLVDLRWHGRAAPLDGLDLSYTVGWLTAIYPVALRLEPSAGPGETLRAVQEQLDQVPGHGLGYDVLRYLSDDPALAEQLRTRPQAQVSFNYLGELDQIAGVDALFSAAPEPPGALWSPRYLIEVQAQVTAARLRLLWKYDERRHRRATIEELARRYLEELRALIATGARSSGYTPADFPLANLSQRDLQQVIAKVSRAKK